jgi:hypothetical protein
MLCVKRLQTNLNGTSSIISELSEAEMKKLHVAGIFLLVSNDVGLLFNCAIFFLTFSYFHLGANHKLLYVTVKLYPLPFFSIL